MAKLFNLPSEVLDIILSYATGLHPDDPIVPRIIPPVLVDLENFKLGLPNTHLTAERRFSLKCAVADMDQIGATRMQRKEIDSLLQAVRMIASTNRVFYRHLWSMAQRWLALLERQEKGVANLRPGRFEWLTCPASDEPVSFFRIDV